MEKPTKEYLQELIKKTWKQFDDFSYCFSDIENPEITYVRTQKRNLTGIIKGFRGLVEMKSYNIKETSKISSNCKYYNKFYKVDDKLKKIECFVGGHNRLDVIYIAKYDYNHCYLFPYLESFEKGIGYPIIVTHIENGDVTEEYIVNTNSILYEKYDYSVQDIVEYYRINFVPEGKYPILDEESGYYNAKTFEYHQASSKVWYQTLFSKK